MRCSDLRDLLHPFLDGELEVSQNIAILKHVELCAACRSRVESEKQLSGIVERAAQEPLSGAERARILNGAFAQVDAHDSSTELTAAPRTRYLLAKAAGLLLALGIGWLAYADPFCLGGCPTGRIMAHAAQSAREQTPLPLGELKRRYPNLQLSALKRLKSCQVEVLGGNVVSTPGTPDRPVFRLRCKKSGKDATFVWIPGGHSHFWQRGTRQDGRVYLKAETQKVRLVGWEDARGVWGCLGDAADDEVLYAMASAVRDAGS